MAIYVLGTFAILMVIFFLAAMFLELIQVTYKNTKISDKTIKILHILALVSGLLGNVMILVYVLIGEIK